MIETGRTYRSPRNGMEIVVSQSDAAAFDFELRLPPGERTLSDGAELDPRHLAVISADTGGESYLSGVPVALQRRLLPLAAAAGRRRGFATRTIPPGA